ncbi:MAG: GNAT family N-acetyltransferase [Pikeienuella sp.]
MVRIVVPDPAVAERLARLAAAAFEGRGAHWTVADFAALGPPPPVAVITDDAIRAGLIVVQIAGDEAEILNFGVVRPARRQGLGTDLLAAAEALAAELGAARLVLEVAVDNAPARGLYARFGYAEIGRRAAYYLRHDGSRVDALVLARPLADPSAPG